MSAPSISPDCWKLSDTPGRGNFSSASPLLSCASPWVVQAWLSPGCGHGGPGFPWPWLSTVAQLHGQGHSGQLVLMQLFYPALCAQHRPDSGAWERNTERKREREREDHLIGTVSAVDWLAGMTKATSQVQLNLFKSPVINEPDDSAG